MTIGGHWVRLFPVSNLKGDFWGGMAAFLVSLPISMTVGIIAFAPFGKDLATYGALAGIYGAVILGIGSVLFGARSIMIPGPRAAAALVLASLITNLLLSDNLLFPSGKTIVYVTSIAFFTMFLVGLIQFLAGITRMGNIFKNIPHPVVAGFVNSTALLLILGQSWTLLDIQKQDSLLEIIPLLGETRPLTMVPALVTAITILLSSRFIRGLSAPLVGLGVGTATYYGMKTVMGGYDLGATLGEVTSRWPTPHIADMFTGLGAGGDLLGTLAMVVPAAISMAALASMDTQFALSAFDEVTEERSDSNAELTGHGGGNMLAAVLGGLVGSGGMIRTLPGYRAGGRTQMMGLITSLLLFGSVVAFADYIQYIPRTVISGMILVLAMQLFDRWSLGLLKNCFSKYIFRRTAILSDLMVVFLVVAVALTFDLITAVGVGLVVSVISFVSRMSKSLLRNEFRGPALHARSVWDHERQVILEKCGHQISVLELEGSIFFGSADGLEARIYDLMGDGVTHIILDMKRVRNVDSTGALVLKRIHTRLGRQSGRLVISYVLKERRHDNLNSVDEERRRVEKPRYIWQELQDSGVVDAIGEDVIFSDTDTALVFCENELIDKMGVISTIGNSPKEWMPSVLRGLTPEEIRRIRQGFTRERYSMGEVIFEQGDVGDALYYLVRGRVDVFVDLGEGGYKKRVQTFKRGAIFGEMAILDDKPRAASVIAAEDSICYRLSSIEFARIKDTDQVLALKLSNSLCIMFSERIRAANIMIAELEK